MIKMLGTKNTTVFF